jgi:alpha-mannosidase
VRVWRNPGRFGLPVRPREQDPAQRGANLANVPRQFHVVPHTHWDREWYRPFEFFQLRLGHVVDEVLHVLESDARFTSFTLDGQAIVLEDYVEVRPQNQERLRSLVSTGRIEIGPSYVLPDELLVGAEPLVRNLLIGRTVCRRFAGTPSPVGYLPDSFGHPLQLPQILAGFGIQTLIFSRGMGDELEEVGPVFRWRAPDGSDVLAFQQLDHYGNFAFVEKPDEAERRVRGILEQFGELLEQVGVDDVLLCNGTDHVPVNAGLPSLLAALEVRFPGSRFTIATYADYVRAVGSVDVRTWEGELLGSRIQNILRGVNSARMYVKQANERAERHLLGVETLAVLRCLRDGATYPAADFQLAWRQLLRCQPHDTICGCSCDEVHRDAMARYESLDRSLSVLADRALEMLAAPDPGSRAAGVINLLPYRRRGLIELPGAEPQIVELDGFSARTVEFAGSAPPSSAGAEDASAMADDAPAIENDLLRIEVAPDGTLTLIDKQRGARLDGLHRLEDEPDMGDLYNFCPTPEGNVWRSERAEVRILARGPVVWELELWLEARRPAGLASDPRPVPEEAPIVALTVVRLVHGSRRVEFRTTIDNGVRDHRLRICFPAGTAQQPVRAETAFGIVRRPATPPDPRGHWVEPPGATQHTLGAVAFGSLALLTKGLPEYEARVAGGEGELCLTLLRCVGVISKPEGALVTRPRTAGPQVATPEGQCPGRHRFEYALVPVTEALNDLALLRESQDYRYGLLTVPRSIALEPGLTLEGEVVFSCLKGADDGDGFILRCFNPSDVEVTARVRGDLTVSRTRLDETGEESFADGSLALAPGQIATLRLRRAARQT